LIEQEISITMVIHGGIMNRKRTLKKHTIVLEANPNAVFPLLCPVREYEWIESWKCDLIYSDSI
jgi:hypothetical protein